MKLLILLLTSCSALNLFEQTKQRFGNKLDSSVFCNNQLEVFLLKDGTLFARGTGMIKGINLDPAKAVLIDHQVKDIQAVYSGVYVRKLDDNIYSIKSNCHTKDVFTYI